jgi:S1-C subfamily serine protease
LALPKLNTAKLPAGTLCVNARQSHLRVGWCYLCGKCDQWHLNLAGGYVLTTNGAVATCYHVVKDAKEIKEGCLVAADENGNVLAVTEVLAANQYSDACILKVEGKDFRPLPLNTNVHPGDSAYCYSDPLDHRGYFTHGIVNRFYQFPGRRPFSAPPEAAYAPTRLNVSTDWAPGSSGSAVLDECGNAIGHVSTISAVEDEESPSDSSKPQLPGPTMIVFHEAVSARDVLRLIQPCK